MYAQFVIADTLPKVDNALNFQKCLIIGNWVMLLSFIVVTCCIVINFVLENDFGISVQIAAHIATIVFAGLLKLGYVLRCIALHGFGKRNF